MDFSPNNTQEPFKSNAPHSASSLRSADDDQEIFLRLNATTQNKIVDNFAEHIRALEANVEPAADLKRKLINNNKWVVQDLIDLPIADRQSGLSTVDFQLEFSLRNRVLANLAKNNLFIRDPNNARFNQQFRSDLVDENNLLIAFLNSLDEKRPDGAQGDQDHLTGNHQTNRRSQPPSYQFGQSPWCGSQNTQNNFTANAATHQNGNLPNYLSNASNSFGSHPNAASFQNNLYPSVPSDHASSAHGSTGNEFGQNSNATQKFTADGLLAEIVRLEIAGFSRFMTDKKTQFKNFRMANSNWALQCVPAASDRLELFLSCCCEDGEFFFHIDEIKLWLVSPKLDHALQGFDKLYATTKDLVLTRSHRSILMTIRMNDLLAWGYLKNDSLSLKVVLKLHA